MSTIEKKFSEKGWKVEFRKSDVVLIGFNNKKISFSKDYRDEDWGYEWELTEIYNKEFPEDQQDYYKNRENIKS